MLIAKNRGEGKSYEIAKNASSIRNSLIIVQSVYNLENMKQILKYNNFNDIEVITFREYENEMDKFRNRVVFIDDFDIIIKNIIRNPIGAIAISQDEI